MMTKNFLQDLNEVQRSAVEDFKGPTLIIAGAGSGKTRVLTYRIAHLLARDTRPNHILALTFTNKAAKEMKERIGRLVGAELSRYLWMGTFHSIFARILRAEGSLLGYPSSYTIYDSADSKNLVKKIIKERNLDDQVYKAAEIFGRISKVKNNFITPAAYAESPQLIEQDMRSRRPLMPEIYREYSMRCKKADAMDFDDLLLNTHVLFRDHPEVAKKYQAQFQYVLVDEYQDTNYVQYLIVNQLASVHKNICVVGDDAQSIYSFRGARIENILNFRHDYPGHKLFKLEQNYRSTRNIVNAANSVIAKNQEQIRKKIWSDNEPGEKIQLVRAVTDNEEGFLVSSLIQDAIYTEHLKYTEIAILYRTNAQSRIFEESLRKLNIPYKIYGSLSFYQRKEIKDLLAYFRLTVNPHDEEALLRVINYPARGIGNTTLNRLDELSREAGTRIWDLLQKPKELAPHFNQGTLRKLGSFVLLIHDFMKKLDTMEAFDLAYSIAETTGILKDLHFDKLPENVSKYENIQELLNGIKDFTESQDDPESARLDSYLQNVSLLTDADNEKDEDRNKVTLMTVHAAKGLEFKNIYVTGMEEELFPSRFSSSTREELEEERRLFYVAITRAMKKATLSYAESRYKWGVPMNCTPSRFIREIDSQYIDEPLGLPGNNSRWASANNFSPDNSGTRNNFKGRSSGFSQKTTLNQVPPPERIRGMKKVNQVSPSPPPVQAKDFVSDDPASIQVGLEVEHMRFGRGKVLNLEGEFPNRKATVFFKNHGQKQLLLKFAKLKILT